MAIPEYVIKNFETMVRAAQDGNLGLMECTLASDPTQVRYVYCAIQRDESGYQMIPFGHVCPGPDPYQHYIPVDAEDAVEESGKIVQFEPAKPLTKKVTH